MGKETRWRSSGIHSRWRDCGSWQGRGGASSCGRGFRSLDWCGWPESFSGSSAGCVAQSCKRAWLRMGCLNSAGRIHSRQRAALIGVVRSEEAKKGRPNKALQQNHDDVLRYGESIGCDLLKAAVRAQDARAKARAGVT
jgi:hypothetical protein